MYDAGSETAGRVRTDSGAYQRASVRIRSVRKRWRALEAPDGHPRKILPPCLQGSTQTSFEAIPDGVALGRVSNRIVDRWNAHGHHPVAYQVETFDMSVSSAPVGQLAAWWPPAGLQTQRRLEGRGRELLGTRSPNRRVGSAFASRDGHTNRPRATQQVGVIRGGWEG